MGKKKNSVAELKKFARRANLELKYEDVEPEGPDNIKRFFKKQVVVGDEVYDGVGNNEKKAKQNAAKKALRSLNQKENPGPVREKAAKNPPAQAHQSMFNGRVNIRAVESARPEPNNAAQLAVGDKEYPAITEKKAAKLVFDGICDHKTAEVPSCSALSEDGARASPSPPLTALESSDAKSKSVATTSWDLDSFTNSSNPPKGQDATIPENVNTGSPPRENTSAQEVSSMFTSKFDCIEPLGKGAFGHVLKARNKLTEKYHAVKIVPCKEIEGALREVKALSDLHHRNIVRYFTCWLEDSGYQWDSTDDSCSTSQSSIDSSSMKYLYIQMELCDTKTLRVWIDEKNATKSLRDSKRRDEGLIIAQQTASGVEYIHSKKLIHRDLKPANIMFGRDGEVKIGDFGLVTDENDDDAENLMERTGYKGTPSYMAPEQKSEKTYDRKVDIFALGLIFVELLWKFSGVHERQKVWDDIRRQKLPERFPHCFHEEYIILRPMLCMKPEERPEASKFKTDLEEYSLRLNIQETERRVSRTI